MTPQGDLDDVHQHNSMVRLHNNRHKTMTEQNLQWYYGRGCVISSGHIL